MIDIERKYFWIPLVLALLCFMKLSTTPFEIIYHSIGVLGIMFNIWLALFIGAPRLLPINLFYRSRNSTRIERRQ